MDSTSSVENTKHRSAPRWIHYLGPLVLAVPFLALGTFAFEQSFISNQHAHFIEKALLAISRGKLEVIGLVYPPIPFILAMPIPRTLYISILASISAGLTVWILCRRMSHWEFPIVAKITVIVSVIAMPEMLFVASQSLSEILGLLLLVISWHDFVSFTRHSKTSSGFFAGLTLGAAFFVNHHVALYSIPFALLVPVYNRDRKAGAALASSFVLFFPMVIAIVSWLYLNWVFTGKSLNFLHAPGAAHLAYYSPLDSANVAYGFGSALFSALRDSMRAPIYWLAAIILVVQRPIRIPALLIPLCLIATTRALGLVYPEHFAVLGFTLMAIIAIPANVHRHWFIPVALCMVTQTSLGYVRNQPHDMVVWANGLQQTTTSENDRQEIEIGALLATLPKHSVLLDDRIAFRLVARARTAEPFLVRADPLYAFAESNPSGFVSYVVTPTRPMDIWQGRLATQYVEELPAGFTVLREWSDWRLLQITPSQHEGPTVR